MDDNNNTMTIIEAKQELMVSPSSGRNQADLEMNFCGNLMRIHHVLRKPNVTSRYYDWWKQSKSYDLPPPPGFTSKYERNQMEGSDNDDHFVVYEPSSSNDEVIANGKGLSSAEFDDFISSFLCDEAEMNSLFCDRNGEKGESFSPFTLDMAIDLENRIQNLERVADKVNEARFGSKD
ncbi:hypothetical protein TSUD_130450 [Trifolium subterraneum]|nr:hypothetical protein TSUD_130450 [Trifolium subterraneum]